jgi:hypothetical protein
MKSSNVRKPSVTSRTCFVVTFARPLSTMISGRQTRLRPG